MCSAVHCCGVAPSWSRSVGAGSGGSHEVRSRCDHHSNREIGKVRGWCEWSGARTWRLATCFLLAHGNRQGLHRDALSGSGWRTDPPFHRYVVIARDSQAACFEVPARRRLQWPLSPFRQPKEAATAATERRHPLHLDSRTDWDLDMDG